jgi:hypothetical protein
LVHHRAYLVQRLAGGKSDADDPHGAAGWQITFSKASARQEDREHKVSQTNHFQTPPLINGNKAVNPPA